MFPQSRKWLIPGVSGISILASLIWHYPPLMVIAAVIAGAPIARNAVRALSVRVIGIDLLVTIAAVGAIIIGEYWEAAAVTFLFAIGAALEAATLAKTRSALSDLVDSAPDYATVIRGQNQEQIPASQVLAGESVVVKTGGKVPVDGVITHGDGDLDEAAITGESMPVAKQIGDFVFAGTILTSGLLTVEAKGVGADTALARIIHRVEEAQDAKAPTAQFIDRFAQYYTPAIIVLSIITGLFTRDVHLALTLLVISCPGALVISIPVSIVAGIGRGARDGVLIKGGEYLEAAAKVNTVAFDKTGTITWGKPALADIATLNGHDEWALLTWASRAEAGSAHPLASAVMTAAADMGVETPTLAESVDSVIGQGIIAQWQGTEILVGNTKLLHTRGLHDGDQHALDFSSRGLTPMIVAADGQVIGVMGVADQVRDQAVDMVSSLRDMGITDLHMLTGDTLPVARSVAGQVGITHVSASLMPEDKLVQVRELQSQGRVVAMVGDGVNDAPALATADVGVAMGAAGSAVALETADIALMADRLDRLPFAFALARATAANLRQNIVIALVTVLLLIVGVLAGGVTMAVGMLVHEASVLVVIANAMRLLRFKVNPPSTGPAYT